MTNQEYPPTFSPADETILKTIADSILVVSKERTVLYANAASEILFEKTGTDLIGSDFFYPLIPSHPVHFEIITKNDEVKTIHMMVSEVRWGGGDAYLVSLRDITELMEILSGLQKKKQELETTNVELMQNASLTSHDLKEPVRKIKIYADRLLQKDAALDTQTRDQVMRISKSADRLKLLITSINEFSSNTNQHKDFKKLDLNIVVKEVLQDLDLAIFEKNVQIEVDALPEVAAVASQIHRLFLNLVLNAIKYSKPHTIPKIFISGKEHKKFVVITVKDNGIGLGDQFAEKIFQPFIRLHMKNVEGSGIGLAICKKIVEAHGGNISVNSEEGKGSCFMFSLRK